MSSPQLTFHEETAAAPPQRNNNNTEDIVVVKDKAEKAVDMIINAADSLNKLFKCNPCNRYRLQQLAYEQKTEQQHKNFDVSVYKTFFMDD
jgi:hypothetical protein